MADALARRGTLGAQLAGHTHYVDAAGRYYHLADLRYQNGVDTYVNALDAQRELYSAKTQWVSTQLEYYQNLITLYKVMGAGRRWRNQACRFNTTQEWHKPEPG